MAKIDKQARTVLLIAGILFLTIGIIFKILNLYVNGYMYDTAQGQLLLKDPTTVTINAWGYIYFGLISLVFYFILKYSGKDVTFNSAKDKYNPNQRHRDKKRKIKGR
ncbi:hypothetical protein GCM10027429_25350 [Marivirga atlantica]|jgi:hypothetical protein|uniref:Uncharacterized protein n=1 Tax=Marivirga atlantica TaxID=1548457 RepID=A0A937A9K5_9BACT|nr:hypothetical protein [Marivirga atlantica]MBL0766135.1 hypothetical protein [Marivirga atlantica]